MATEEGARREQRLPEVPLKWSDFMWSLEKLRHKPYSKNTTESDGNAHGTRDWFRVNPLEMVLLGCQTLSTRQPASRDHGTMVLVMECLECQMYVRPRYWSKLLAVLIETCKGNMTPLVLQRCVSTLVGFWKSFQNFPEIEPALYSWGIHEMKIVNLFEWLVKEKECALGQQLLAEVKSLIVEIQSVISSSRDAAIQFRKGDNVIDHILVPIIQSAILDSDTLSLQLFLMRQQSLNMLFPSNRESLSQLAQTLKTISCDITSCLSHLINIILLLNWRQSDLNKLIPSLNPGLASTEQITEVESMTEDFHPTPNDLLVALMTALTRWDSMVSSTTQKQDLNDDVASKLLCLAHLMLASGSLDVTLPLATEFFTSTITTLMIYSTEGYLTNSPRVFFSKLLEYASSLIEQGIPPGMVIQTNLPNLFGPIFGIRNHSVSCKLLEYGYLAACSQHKESLLSEGLQFLINVFHLFPPIDKARLQMTASQRRIQIIETVREILDDLLTSALQTADELEGISSSQDDVHVVTTGNTQEINIEEGRQAKGESESKVMKARGQSIEIEVSDAEREADNDIRLQILLNLLEMACSMIRNGDNISFICASALPKLFSSSTPNTKLNENRISRFYGEQPPTTLSCIPWQVDKKRFAIQLLELATLSLENNMASPFHICGVVVPKLVQNLDCMQFSDEEKMSLVTEIINISYETLENGHSINELISHGIDLLSALMPQSSPVEEVRQFIRQMTRHFVAASHTSLLFLLKQSCQFMMRHLTEETVAIQGFFKSLIIRGKRDEIRCVFRLCRCELELQKYKTVRQSLYSYSTGGINHRQLIALSEILLTLMELEKPSKVDRELSSVQDEGQEEEVKSWKRKEEETVLVVGRLTEPCLERLITVLIQGRFKKQEWEEIARELSRIALFRTLFHEEISTFINLSAVELHHTFQSKFPPEVLGDMSMMQLLALCASRIEHMQVPRYQSLKSLLSRILQHFLTLKLAPCSLPEHHSSEPVSQSSADINVIEYGREAETCGSGEESTQTVLGTRMRELENYLLNSFSRNSEDREKLMECGYSAKLWENDDSAKKIETRVQYADKGKDEGMRNMKLSLDVVTDGSHSLEENMRQTLLACYREFADILKQMAITHVPVDGEMVKASELFNDELSLAELKGRRAVAVRVIDARLGRAKEGHFHEKKIALLAKEDEIEADFEKQAKAPVKPKKFTVSLNTCFFDCARCCGAQIIGCYAPNGEHCERPLEIGMRCDSAIASIYDEVGLEIENVEILFTHEGAYMFKSYSNGHPYDTSQVWIAFLTALLENQPSSLVPAVIIPKSYPNKGTWDTIRRNVSTELTGGILTCQHDFSPEWRSYYDHRPEKVRMGVDVVLHPGFSLSSDPGHSRPTLSRQRSRITKDLAGMIFDHVMGDLLQDEWWKHFRFLGKCISQYLSECVQEGESRASIVHEGLDYERWRKNFLRMENPPLPTTGGIPLQSGVLPTKQQLVTALIQHIDALLKDWSTHTLSDMTELCTHNHRQFLELKRFVEKSRGNLVYLKEWLPNIRDCLMRCIYIVPLLSLRDSLQEEVIHWIFRNEDRVWRYRGGRDGRETLQQFMSFLGRNHEHKLGGRQESEEEGVRESGLQETGNLFAGVVAFCVPCGFESRGAGSIAESFQVKQMIGYAVGEVIKPSDEIEEVIVVGDSVDGEEESNRWHPQHNQATCYEIVTAWVHPSYRGLNLAVQLYLDIVERVPTELIMCDLLEGSVERIIQSNVLLRLLERLNVLSTVLHHREKSYTVVTQTGVREQFEQVVFSVRPVRVAIKLHHFTSRVKAAAVVVLQALTGLSLIIRRRWNT